MQNILALLIVFGALAVTVVSVLRNLKVKKSHNCEGCSGCDLKQAMSGHAFKKNC